MATSRQRASSAKKKSSAVASRRGRLALASGNQTRRSSAKADQKRIASRGSRFKFENAFGRLPNPDPTLRKFSGYRGVGLYSLIIQEFSFVGGYCSQWIDHVLTIDRAIKAAKVDDPDQQLLADAAAVRAQKAWGRVRNRVIVLQKLLMGRFYGFSRAEKVWRFDRVVKEWIQDLYDVPWEAWNFDDAENDYLVTATAPFGLPVDSSRFIHFQWGSADTKYGQGELSEVYLALWYIQKIQEFGLQAVEDWSRLIAIVHIPRGFDPEDRAKTIAAVAEQYRFYLTVTTDEQSVKVETPNGGVTANGTAGRQEYEVIRFYERWIQIRLLGAPQTQDKGGAGNGKLDEVRKGIWEDKTPLGSSALDQCLTEGWLDPYCDMNMADLAVELRPHFESDTSEVTQGGIGVGAQAATDIGMKLAAKQVTATFAEEILAAIGIPRARAKAMVDSIIKERDALVTVETLPRGDTPDPSQQPADSNPQVVPQQEAA